MILTGLTTEQLAKRRFSIGASDATIILNGTPDQVHDLYLQKIGEKKPDDLAHILPVRMGIQTEPLNLEWFTRETGIEVVKTGREVYNLEETSDEAGVGVPRTATLDGETAEPAVVECKHVHQFAKEAEVLAKYLGQLHQQMYVTGFPTAHLSVFIGTMKYVHFHIEPDPFYMEVLLEKTREFWTHVQNKTEPYPTEPVAPPVLVSDMRVVDMSESNAWGEYANSWLETLEAKKRHDGAAKEIKALVEADVREATGHGVIAKRDKRGAIRLSEVKT